jgi:hypothetical protein
MGSKDDFSKSFRRVGKAVLTGGLSEAKAQAKLIEKPFRTGKSAAARTQASQQLELINKQRQSEKTRLAAAESEVATRVAGTRGKRQGRSLLIATSPTGIPRLGG